MIEYKNEKEYWNGHECDGNFIFRTLADMFPGDYEKYMKESLEFKKNNTVLCCDKCGYKWVLDNSKIEKDNYAECPSCKKQCKIENR